MSENATADHWEHELSKAKQETKQQEQEVTLTLVIVSFKRLKKGKKARQKVLCRNNVQ